MLVGSRRENKRFCTERYEALPEFIFLFISSLIRFLSVIFIPKYLNFATFSKDFSYFYVKILHCLLSPGIVKVLFYPDDNGSRFLRNTDNVVLDYTVSYS